MTQPMDESQGFSGEPQGQGGESFQQVSPQGTGINPAWNEMLGTIPQELHSKVLPHLQKWDQGVQNRFQQVHSQYEPYKPFIDNNVTPSDIEFAMGLVNAINNDPRAVQEALNAWIEQEGIQDQQAQQGTPGEYYEQGQGTPDFTQHPEYQRMQQMVESMADILMTREEEDEQSQADAELDEELTNLREQFGDFDEPFVLSKMMSGMSGEDAVKAWGETVNQILTQQRRPGPKLLGAGGNLPSQQIDVKQMDRKATKNLVAEMLQNASQQE